MTRVEMNMKKLFSNCLTKIGEDGLVVLPDSHGFRAGQRMFVHLKNASIFLTDKPAGPMIGKRRFSMRVRRVTTASRNVIYPRPQFKQAK